MIAFLASFPRCRAALAAVFLACSAGTLPAAGLHPALISADQSAQAPYRDSGRIQVQQGRYEYFGTASYLRRYTGLTAGHILYSPRTGLAIDVNYQPALYREATSGASVSYFAVLAGYQQAANQGGDDSDAAFGQDMGYLIFNRPAPQDEWAAWSTQSSRLMSPGPFLLFGYAAESFPGNVLAAVRHTSPYFQDTQPALYQNEAYYTESGMSGGPVYATLPDGTLSMVAINVAGTSYSQRAESGARAITSAEGPLLLAAEYDHGIIRGGVIKGPTTVPAGGTAKFKTGLIFPDGPQVKNTVAARYDADLQLIATGSHRKTITIIKTKPAKYTVTFPANLRAGTEISLGLFRAALPQKNQTPLQTLIVTVQ